MRMNEYGKKEILPLLILRIISLLLAVSVFCVGCASGDTPSSKTQPKKENTPVSSDSDENTDDLSSDGETQYDTETVIEYYDDEYTTDPGSWKTGVGGQRTVQNLPAFSFKEENYENVTYGGGTDTRTENFIRGMGISSYYSPTKGWGGLPAFDNQALNELGVNSRRCWGETARETFTPAQGMTYVDTIHSDNWSDMPKTEFADGKKGVSCFASSDYVNIYMQHINDFLTNPAIFGKNLFCYLLGNEYRYFLKNYSLNYAWSVYDATTLNDFRNNWCKSRFGTISNFNKLCDTSYNSFDDIMPEANKNVFYECWLYLRQTFRDKMRQIVTSAKQINPSIKWGYAAYFTKNNPLSDYLFLDFLDYSSENLYPYNASTDKDDYKQFAFSIDNLVAWSETAPVLITEHGTPNGDTAESKAAAARLYLQTLNMFYMRPRVVGTYIFTYAPGPNPDSELGSKTWGMVSSDRSEKYPSFYSVSEVYNNFKYLDKFYNGASNTPLVAVSNNAVDNNKAITGLLSSNVTKALYANGVPVEILPIDDANRVSKLKSDKIVITDNYLYESPDGSNSVAKAINEAMNNGSKVLSYANKKEQSIYGKNKLNVSDKNYLVAETSTSTYESSWKILGKYIHADFIAGKIKPDSGKINENAVRILEAKAYNNYRLGDSTWDLNMQMVYKNGHMYLCVVNEGKSAIDKVEITVGVNNGVRCNLNPQLMRGSGTVSVSRPDRANIPSYIDKTMQSKIAYGTISISNLDTYAYIDLGMAILQ